MKGFKKFRLSSFQIIIVGFVAVIIMGAALLTLPISSVKSGSASFFDALFTATSACCVTGLVVQDTATYWTEFGHAVILVLIQIGGLGVVTVTLFASMLAGKKIGLMQRSTMQEAIAAPQVGGIVKTTSFILRGTLIIELIGAVIMLPAFISDFGAKGIWYAVFHSISAFCNAGFDLMGVNENFSSMIAYYNNLLVNITLMALIIVGGLGFFTWGDIVKHGIHFKRYRMQSKVIITISAALIVLPFLYYFFFEFGGSQWGKLTLCDRITVSAFQAVTPRTAGFNTVDLSQLSDAGLLIMIFLMLVGGSPGSTAGGMKTTTLAVLISSAISVFHRRESAHFFGRRISVEKVRQASAVVVLYLGLFLFSAIAISKMENVSMMSAMFEAGSAVATVGLSLGLTPTLGAASRALLIVLMFMGRVGGLTVIFAAISSIKGNTAQLPQENISVG